ncbi:uncharacterized protein LOC143815703 isoform X2 [Ranitomeya variabilis]|uniref:uncharacterized protein LOC143815703 isoform X2 n=1 Tax=Ranitomeya variabilis TaxID=490064 RepID=UPI004057BA18
MLAIMSWIVLLIYAASCAFADTCLVEISIESKIIKEMIDTQGYFCSMPVKILSKEKVAENCDLWALVYEVDGLLEKLNFTPGTRNYENKNKLIDSFKDCLAGEQHSVLDAVKSYLQTVNLNPIEILQRVNDSLHKLNRFHASSSSVSECESYYKKHGQNNNDATKEQFEDGRKKEHDQSKLPLIIIVILVMLVLLFLCGFLYYKHQYQALQRRLNISYDLDLDRNPSTVLPEERVHLQIIECENV